MTPYLEGKTTQMDSSLETMDSKGSGTTLFRAERKELSLQNPTALQLVTITFRNEGEIETFSDERN